MFNYPENIYLATSNIKVSTNMKVKNLSLLISTTSIETTSLAIQKSIQDSKMK